MKWEPLLQLSGSQACVMGQYNNNEESLVFIKSIEPKTVVYIKSLNINSVTFLSDRIDEWAIANQPNNSVH